MLTSDALYLHDSYGPPAVGSPIVWESEKWKSSVEIVRKLAIENEALIFPGHDATGIKQFASHTEPHTIEFWPGYEYE
jgi:glyoxylase-like metal-dependent hydrolase (beta-lactamase superfamily II)